MFMKVRPRRPVLSKNLLRFFCLIMVFVRSKIEKCTLVLFVMTLAACQSYIKPDFERLSAAMQAKRVTTPFHQHLVLTSLSPKSSTKLHVYIEGDGRPWIKRFLVAKNPTPQRPFALALMRQDQHTSLYLGRPCYFNEPAFGLNDTACDASLWTNARYSDKVVMSMVDALRQSMANMEYAQLTLIGHSGGGTLALLMAQQMPEVDQVVTIAANLDVDAWVKHHHYSALTESLDPALITTPRPQRQHHYGGSKDTIVPPALNQAFLTRVEQRLIVIEGFDHHCCWIDYWPTLLEQIE